MSEVKISAEPRTEFGKGGARRTRRAGKVPAVLYGHGEKPRHIAVPAREFAAAIRHGGMMQVFNIEISDGSVALALPKAIQKDPIRDTFEHIDLLVVRRGEKVNVDVPVHVIGEAVRGTLVVTEHNTLAILADATQLPEFVEASIEGLDAGATITAGQIVLPAGVELIVDPEQVVVSVTAAPTEEQMAAGGSGTETVESIVAAAEEAPVEASA